MKVISSLNEIISNESVLIDSELIKKCWLELEHKVQNFLDVHPVPGADQTSPKISLNSLLNPCDLDVVNPESSIYMYYHAYPEDTFLEIFHQEDKEKLDYVEGLVLTKKTLEAFIQAFYFVFEFPKKQAFWHGLYGRDYAFHFTEEDFKNATKGRRLGLKDIRKFYKPGLFIVKSSTSFTLYAYALGAFGKVSLKSIKIEGKTISRNPERILWEGQLYLY